MIDERKVKTRLVEHGRKLCEAPKEQIRFTKNDEADRLLNDLAEHPHAFVLACIMDRQIKAEKAWLIPYRFKQKLGDFSMGVLANLSEADMHRIMTDPEPLHRYTKKMSSYFFQGVARIRDVYGSNAANIWADSSSSATVVYRFLEFEGIGPKIASMAANILAREFKIKFSDYYSIDISADVHVRRVFSRLGLTTSDASVEQLIFRARGLYPEFPGLMDFPAWEIGRNWCRPRTCDCDKCYMADVCSTAQKV